MDNTEIGKRIKQLREKRKYTREVLAEKANIAPQFLFDVETGKKGMSAESLAKISKALLCSSDYILTGKELSNEDQIKVMLSKMEQKELDMLYDILVALWSYVKI